MRKLLLISMMIVFSLLFILPTGWVCAQNQSSAESNQQDLVELGLSYFRLGMFSDAIQTLKKGLEGNTSDKTGWQSLAAAYRAQGLYNEAEETYQLVLRLDDKDPWVWFEIGNLYYDMRDYQLAIDAYENSITL